MEWTAAISSMNWVDFSLLGILAVFITAGYLKGFARQVLQITGIFGAFFAAARLTPALADRSFFDDLRRYNADAPHVISYIAVFFGVAAAVSIVVNLILERFRSQEALKPSDSLFGGLLGGIKGVLLLGGICIGLLEWNGIGELPSFRESVIAPRMAEGCRTLVFLIPEKGRRELEDAREEFERRISTDQRVHLDPGISPPDSGSPPAKKSEL